MAENSPTPTGTFKILYFAYASSYTKKSEELLPAPMRLSELFETLDKRYPRMKDKVLGACMVTVNLEYVDVDTNEGKELKAGDEVGIIPPVSSG
ncbi:molybdopterin synthase-like protein small subunit CnxG [Tuber indicum]|nr:molybdopterin synthase-like protein small subunit CnxG [Tuber indicum]